MSDLPRRAVLRATALTGLGAAAVGPAGHAGGARPGAPPAGILAVTSRTEMAAHAREGAVLFLTEPGREGMFACRAGPLPAGDPLQGLFVPAAGGLHLARLWDGTHARPEWFGAVTGDRTADCADAIEACFALCPVTELAQADYHLHRTLRLNRGNRTLRGTGSYAQDEGIAQSTRLILVREARGASTDDILVAGSATAQPPMPDSHFAGFALVREADCTPHASGDLARYPAGLRISYVLRSTFRDISALESSVGFYIGNAVYTKVEDCLAQRMRAGTGPARDYNAGFYLNGHVGFGYAGGNASLYLTRCVTADQHPAHVDAAGLVSRGAFVDSFIDQFESARIATGMSLSADGARAQGQTIDLHIRNPVLDGCSRFGIDLFLDEASSASVEILDPYIATAGGGAERGIAVHGGAGLITITGGQVHGDHRGGALWLSRTRGIRVQGLKIHQSNRAVVIDEASGLQLEPQVNIVGTVSPAAAIEANALSRSSVRPIVVGAGTGSYRVGVALDAACHHVAVDGSAIDPLFLTSRDPADKVRFAGSDARAAAPFIRAGNRLEGVID